MRWTSIFAGRPLLLVSGCPLRSRMSGTFLARLYILGRAVRSSLNLISLHSSSRRRRRTLSLLRSRAGPLAAGTPLGPSGCRRTFGRPSLDPAGVGGNLFSVASSPRPPEVATAIFLPPIALTFLIYGDC